MTRLKSIESHRDSGDQINYTHVVEYKQLLNLLQLDAILLKQLTDDEVHVSAANDEAENNPDQKPVNESIVRLFEMSRCIQLYLDPISVLP